MKKILFLLLLMLVTIAQAQQSMGPVPVDKDVRIGKLDNGLTYYIRYNNWPEHRANFYIAQNVGSIQEEDSQRGLAHFLEHMCFNGTKNFPENNVVRYCESIGVQFGADLNAFTSIDKTVYNIDDVPTANQSSLDSCLLILHDWSHDLTLDPVEIDKERGVIHEEWRLRTSATSRMFERNLETLYPDSKYGKRYPIGLMSVIDSFKPQELRDYYEKWYHPTNQAIIVVGDVDVDHIEAKIKELFSDIKNPENAAQVQPVAVPDNKEAIVVIDKDKECKMSDVEVMLKTDAIPDQMKGDISYLVMKYVIGAATSMMNNRFVEASQKADCPYASAECGYDDYIFARTKSCVDFDITPKDPSMIESSLKAAMIELKKASKFGFTQTEYDRYKQDYLSGWEKAVSNKDKRTSSQFCREYWVNYLNHEPIPSIDDEYAIMQQVSAMLPLQAINQMIAQVFPETDENVVIISFNNEKEGATYPTRESLLGALNQARTAEITAFVDNVKNEPLIAKLPKPGKIVSETANDKFGYKELTLSNGVKVVLKQTDFKKDEVRMSGEGKGGETLYGKPDYANLDVFAEAISYSGLGNFTSTELQKALAGKIANAELTLSDRYTHLSGSSTPKDVETMLQMAYLYFTNIKKDTASFNNMMSQYEIALKNRDLDPNTALRDSITATLYGHNPRMAPMTLGRLQDVSYDRILQIAKERTASAEGWEFTFIGNFDEAALRPLICRYLGSLPTKKVNPESKRAGTIVNGQIDNIFTRKQETPKATAIVVWSNPQLPYTHEHEVQADMVGQLLSMSYLKKIREDASAAYSCGAYGTATLGRDGYHNVMIQGYCPMKPEKKDIAIKIMKEELPQMMDSIDQANVDKVKELMLKHYDDNQKKNDYWSEVIDMWRYFGIDIQTEGRKIIENQTVESLKGFVQKFLGTNNRIVVVMLPEE